MAGQGSDTLKESASAPSLTKAIGSLAKKPSEVTRQGAQKLKFVPTLPAARRKTEYTHQQHTLHGPSSSSSSSTTDRGRGYRRGKEEGKPRGRGRGASRPDLEMTASGPFAMGPALAGNNARQILRSTFAPVQSHGSSTHSRFGLLHGTAQSLRKVKIEEDAYSDPDEGVELIDMENVHEMDWMAPESLRKERNYKKAKKEGSFEAAASGDIDHVNALDLSENEDEEELEDIIEHFAAKAGDKLDPTFGEDKLYLFQFPAPFPVFVSKDASLSQPSSGEPVPPTKTTANEAGDSQPKIDGVIGRLEIYRSGVAKMRLANGIVLDVNAATQPSFLQHAVHLDMAEKRISTLGEVNKRFNASPNVETLLSAMDLADKGPTLSLDGQDLIHMDTA